MRGENLDCREVRNIVLDQCLTGFRDNGDTCTVCAPLVETIPKISQPKILNALALQRIPQRIKVLDLCLPKNTQFQILNSENCFKKKKKA